MVSSPCGNGDNNKERESVGDESQNEMNECDETMEKYLYRFIYIYHNMEKQDYFATKEELNPK